MHNHIWFEALIEPDKTSSFHALDTYNKVSMRQYNTNSITKV